MDIQQQFKAYNPPVKDVKRLPFPSPAKMIGRNQQLGALHGLLKNGKATVLIGAPGIGKTAHCAVLATALSAVQPSGVLWLSVMEDDTPQLIARVGRAFGVDTYGADGSTNATRLRNLLAVARPLIILDGVPDLDAVANFAARCAPGLPLLVTADAAAATNILSPVYLSPLTAEDSAALYLATAAPQTPPPAAEIAALCNRLGGNPGSIIIAARMAAQEKLSPAQLAAALPADPAQALPTLLNLTMSRLPAPIPGLLYMLAGMFANGATLRVISALSGIPEDKLVSPLRLLAWRGLAAETMLGGLPAFTLAEGVRAHLRASLRETDRLAGVEGRALGVLRAYATHSAKGADLDGLTAELDNLLGAAAYATSTRDSASLQMLIDALSIAETRGFKPEADKLRQLKTILSRSSSQREASDTEVASSTAVMIDSGATPIIQPLATEVQTLRKATSQPEAIPAAPAPTRSPAKHSDAEGAPAAATQVSAPTSVTTLEEAQPMAPLRMERTEAPAQTTQAARVTTPIPAAPPPAPEAPHAPNTPNAPNVEPEPTPNIPDIPDAPDTLAPISEAAERGDYATVIRLAGERLPTAGKTTAGELYFLLANAQRATGSKEQALQSYSQAVEAFRGGEAWPKVAAALSQMALTFIQLGRWDEASMMHDQAAVIYHRFGLIEAESATIAQIAQAAADFRHFGKATDYYNRALYLARERSDRRAEAHYLFALAENEYFQKDFPGAVSYYRAALHNAYLLEDAALQAEISGALARLLLEDVRTLNQAVQLAREAVAAAPGDPALKRLLKRAEARLSNINKGGLAIAPAEGSNREYAAGERQA